MPVTTITSIRGIGGNPPTQIEVKGEVSGCEEVYVTISCSRQIQRVAIPNGGLNSWTVIFTNDLGCTCGSNVTAKASCTVGFPSTDTLTVTLPLDCPPPDCCEEVILTRVTNPLPCIPQAGGNVQVQFSAALLPAGCTSPNPFEWKVTNVTTGAVLQNYTAGGANFSYNFNSAATYRVNVRVQQDEDCDDPTLTDSETFTLLNCVTTPCAINLSGPQSTPCTDGSPTAPQTYTATTSTPYAGTYSWDVFSSGNPTPIFQNSGGVASLTYSFPGPGTYTVNVSIQTQGCANPTASASITVTVPPCTPPTTTPTPTTTTRPPTTPPTTPTTPTTPPTTPTPTDGGGGFTFSLCCMLIFWWGISHLVAGTLLYFGLWPAGLISAGVATLALGLWIAFCCWPCALTFWRCCTLLRWQVMFNDALVVTLFGLYALGTPGVPAVLFGFSALSIALRIALSASRCGAIPNIFDPTTYPPCRCP